MPANFDLMEFDRLLTDMWSGYTAQPTVVYVPEKVRRQIRDLTHGRGPAALRRSARGRKTALYARQLRRA